MSTEIIDRIEAAVAQTGHAEVYGRWHSQPSHLTTICINVHEEREVDPDYTSYCSEFSALGQELALRGYAVDYRGPCLTVHQADSQAGVELRMLAALKPGDIVRLNHNLGDEVAQLTSIERDGWCPTRWWGVFADRNRMTLGWVRNKLITTVPVHEFNYRPSTIGVEVAGQVEWWQANVPVITVLAQHYTARRADPLVTLAKYSRAWDHRRGEHYERERTIGTYRLTRDDAAATISIIREK